MPWRRDGLWGRRYRLCVYGEAPECYFELVCSSATGQILIMRRHFSRCTCVLFFFSFCYAVIWLGINNLFITIYLCWRRLHDRQIISILARQNSLYSKHEYHERRLKHFMISPRRVRKCFADVGLRWERILRQNACASELSGDGR